MLGSCDVVAEVEGGGLASQSLALRLAISRSLVSSVSEDMLLKMTVGKYYLFYFPFLTQFTKLLVHHSQTEYTRT